jgi:hypothetical protein
MTAKELRIGNLIYHHYYTRVPGTPDEKEHFDICKVESIEHELIVNGKNTVAWYQPIPLTEERLVELGFKKLTDRAIGFKQSSYSIGNGMVIVNFDDGLLNVDFYRTLNYKYVHQLQNLYFALTGSELTIKSN